eukprot:TRINITY_DN5536_c0_g1_i1.p2 TRINITY_DN5536_c0_g1~~TRINITY_DN5536_c0_g1_i1.p2  ORF type:complete len:54 (+),score=30.57 TRINITY_DN5536_c0_g1_i1:149-310(+)
MNEESLMIISRIPRMNTLVICLTMLHTATATGPKKKKYRLRGRSSETAKAHRG